MTRHAILRRPDGITCHRGRRSGRISDTDAAALLTHAFGDPEVPPAAFPTARPGQLVLRNRAIAVNPLDLIEQTTANVMYRTR